MGSSADQDILYKEMCKRGEEKRLPVMLKSNCFQAKNLVQKLPIPLQTKEQCVEFR